MVARGTPPSALHPGGTRVESARPPPPRTALPHMLPQHADVYVYAAARRPQWVCAAAAGRAGQQGRAATPAGAGRRQGK